jgi:hypothetical protein
VTGTIGMQSKQFPRLIAAACFAVSAYAQVSTFRTVSADAAPWIKILGSVGIVATGSAEAPIVVAGANAPATAASLASDHFLILEGYSPLAQALGFSQNTSPVSIRRIIDARIPSMDIVWEQTITQPAIAIPEGYKVFAHEKWQNAPVLAGKLTAHGAVLWMATSPGVSGIERYPYILQALVDLGLPLPARSTSLWAFFDSSYRIRADVDYLARRWRQSGIGVLHVAGWHNMEPDKARDEYLANLIAACHRNAILVYAWLELPHVSEKFWADHPEWREKTAIGQDAQLDWRKLMNLQNPECRRAVASDVNQLLDRFDWDGVNVAELYFESLEGASNPARFTPMNDDVRRDFQKTAGFDPKLLFDPASLHAAARDPAGLRQFLDYRAALASRMQSDWLQLLDQTRAQKPYLDVVLTHIDDRFEPGIRDALGADVARSLPLIQARRSTLLVEDPATIWNLGASRYAKLAAKYKELTPDQSHIAIDINVVERYQDVYPTKKQTGVELFELVHQAASSFARVALYFENSLEKQDLQLLPAAATTAQLTQPSADELEVSASDPTRIDWQGLVELDGKQWPIQNAKTVLVPPGKHRLRPGITQPAVTLADFNGQIRSAAVSTHGLDLSYTSASRAIAMLGSPVSSIEVDGSVYWTPAKGNAESSVLLPAGQHLVTFTR